MKYNALVKSEIIGMVPSQLESEELDSAIHEAVKKYGKNHKELVVVDENNEVVYCHATKVVINK